jgi:hypothetical protein
MMPAMRLVTFVTLFVASTAMAQVSQPVAPAPGPAPEAKEVSKGKLTTKEVESTEAPEPPVQIGVGGRFRFIWMPTAVLNLFLGHSTTLTSWSAGGEIIRRKGNLDMVWGLEYANISPADGLYLEKGKDPGMFGDYPDKIHFDGFSMISVDWSFIWHTDLTPFMQLRYGAGIGVGFTLGNIQKFKMMCDADTTPDELDDINTTKCRQQTTTPVNADMPSRVWPIVNLLAGLRFQLVDQLALNVELGFRDVFFGGLSLGYFF